jgi:hypothetical protein
MDSVNVELQEVELLNIFNATEDFEVIGKQRTPGVTNRIANTIDENIEW